MASVTSPPGLAALGHPLSFAAVHYPHLWLYLSPIPAFPTRGRRKAAGLLPSLRAAREGAEMGVMG